MFKMHSSENRGFLIPAVIGFLVGLIACLAFITLFNITNVKINLSLDVVGFLTVFVNIGLAVYLLRVLQRQDDGDKVERDLLIGYLDKFESQFSSEIHLMTSGNGVEGTKVAGMFKKYNMHLQELVGLLKGYSSDWQNVLADLEKSLSEVQELLTNVPRDGEIEDGVRVDGTRILYSPNYIGTITVSMGRFKKAIFSVVVAINRS